jgi:hypothetical protein
MSHKPIGERNRNISAEVQHFMAERAGAERTISVADGSHALAVSQPEPTAQLILEAAAAVTRATSRSVR